MSSKNNLFVTIVALFVIISMVCINRVLINTRQQEHDQFVSEALVANKDSCLIFLQREINDVVVDTYKSKSRLYVKLANTHPYRLYGVWAPGFEASKGDSLLKKPDSFEIQVAYKRSGYENRKVYHSQDGFDCKYWDDLIRLEN